MAMVFAAAMVMTMLAGQAIAVPVETGNFNTVETTHRFDVYDSDGARNKPWHGIGVNYWQRTEIGANTDKNKCISCPPWSDFKFGTSGAWIFGGWNLDTHTWNIQCGKAYAYRVDECKYVLGALGGKGGIITLQTGWLRTKAEISGCKGLQKLYEQTTHGSNVAKSAKNMAQTEVNVGDWVKLNVSSSIDNIANISTVRYTVTNVNASRITFDALFKFVNGTEATTTLELDPTKGSGSAQYLLIHQNLDVGDPLYENSNFSVIEITTHSLPGGEREVVRATVTEPVLNQTVDAFWDRETGFLVQFRESIIVYPPTIDYITASLLSAESVGGKYNIIKNDGGATVQPVLIGQDLDFFTNWGPNIVTIYRVKEGVVVWTKMADPGNTLTIAGDDWRKEGAFYVNFNEATTERDAQLSFDDPNMPLSLKVGTTEVSSIAVGTSLTIDTGGMNLFPNDIVDLKIVGPDGRIKYDGVNDQQFTDITVDYLRSHYGDNNLKTTGWSIGDYTLKIKTKPEYACGLEAESAIKELKVIKEVITIEADKTSTVELDTVALTVTGVAGDKIKVEGDSANVVFKKGVDDTPTGADFHGNWFTDAIDEDGIRKYAVEFDDTGTFTIRVDVTGPEGNPRIGDYDTVDITVSEKGVTFDLPTTVVIGEKLTIKGTANTGDWVAIAFDDVIPRGYNKLTIDENGEFSKDINTGIGSESGKLKSPGSVRVKAFINWELPTGASLPFDITSVSTI